MQRVTPKILVVDDERAICEVLEMRLHDWGYDVLLANDGASALRVLQDADPDLIVSDVCLPDVRGVDLIESFRSGGRSRPVILMTAFGTIDVAVEAMKRGASDFLTKPLDHARLHATIERLEEEIDFSRATSTGPGDPGERGFGALVGGSRQMRDLFALIERLAVSDAPVFLCGESGTGKEVVARTIHARSRRAKAPFVALNMAALPAGVIDSELFGHARGSFTGAVAARPGAFELANKGTLFLDELAEMPADLQPKLLRALEDGSFRPVGGRDEVRVDARVLAATNRNTEEAIREGKLRQDLFYRLNVFMLVLPPLRERRDDIPLLVRHFVAQFSGKHAPAKPGAGVEIDSDALDVLLSYDWPGNVRELRNAVERALILSRDGRLHRADLPAPLSGAPVRETAAPREPAGEAGPAPLVLPSSVTAAEAERLLVMEILRQVNNNKAAAARRLGMDVKTIRNKLKAWGVGADSE